MHCLRRLLKKATSISDVKTPFSSSVLNTLKIFSKWFWYWIAMVFTYPEFHGRNSEDVEEFLEQMEVACISN